MQMAREDLEILACRFASGQVDRHEIYSFADRCTTAGEDDAELVSIMIEGKDATVEEVAPFFEAYLRKQGATLPSAKSSLFELAACYARKYEGGKIDAEQAAYLIWKDVWLEDNDREWQLDPIIYWSDEAEDEFFCTRAEALANLDKYLRKLAADSKAGNIGE